MHHRSYLPALIVAFFGLLPGTVLAQVPPVPSVPAAPLQPPPASAAPAPAGAGTGIAGCRLGKFESATFDSKEVEGPNGKIETVTILIKQVRVDCDDATQFFADEAELYREAGRVTARGNVLFVQGGNRISAERMEFNTKTRTGTFYEAFGQAKLGPQVERSMFGTQEPDVMFWGREMQKIGPETYRIKGGGFTSCAQPTPRWEVSSGTLTIKLDDYALMSNAVLRVKGVPILYMPAFYYPLEEDDRSTGFILPSYGNSTVKGQTLSNAFFWALGRSHDATFYHDWFSKAGMGYGAQYRYELGGGSRGMTQIHFLDENENTYTGTGGVPVTRAAQRSYRIDGSLSQNLGGGLRARASADYFSDIGAQQLYQQDVYRATNRQRHFGGNITGNWSEYTFSATLDRADIFYPDGTITTNGGLPRVNFTRGERPIGQSRVYFGLGSEYVTFLRSTTRDDLDESISDQGLTRVDVSPIVRIPFTRWPFFTINSSVAYRATFWSESIDPVSSLQVEEGISRQYLDFTARITGPVFNRIFNRPGSNYAEKLKHVVEPVLSIQKNTPIDQFDEIVKLDQTDYIVGNVTRFTYGLNNRLYAKKNVSREILSVNMAQTFYTDANASQYDRYYQSSFSGVRASKFSPVAITVRTSPTDRVSGEFKTEWDHYVNAFTIFEANAIVNRDLMQVSAGWSQRRFLEDLPGFDDPNRATHYINSSTSIRSRQNRVGATYSFNYDLRLDQFLQQRYLAYYNAQCCGFGFEYQSFNFSNGFAGVPIPQDRRFNISVTLAGVGSFSNLLGAFGGQGR
jgi:LPS-assembly protein